MTCFACSTILPSTATLTIQLRSSPSNNMTSGTSSIINSSRCSFPPFHARDCSLFHPATPCLYNGESTQSILLHGETSLSVTCCEGIIFGDECGCKVNPPDVPSATISAALRATTILIAISISILSLVTAPP